MKIFEKEQEDNNKIYIFKDKDWRFEKDGETYSMTPSSFVQWNLSPIIIGADKAIKDACEAKKITEPEKGFYLFFSDEASLDSDVRLELKENMLDGWVYDVFSENLKINTHQKIWACKYLNLYFEKPPKKIYLKIQKNKV